MYAKFDVICNTFIFWPVMQKLQSWNAPYGGLSVRKKYEKNIFVILIYQSNFWNP